MGGAAERVDGLSKKEKETELMDTDTGVVIVVGWVEMEEGIWGINDHEKIKENNFILKKVHIALP